jgi:hypothetical protein
MQVGQSERSLAVAAISRIPISFGQELPNWRWHIECH